MFCRNCGNEVPDQALVCTKCGVKPNNGQAHCQACGKPTQPAAVVCVNCGVQLAKSDDEMKSKASSKIAAGICGIVLGCFGVHKFILGYTTAGIIMLLVSLLSCGLLAGVMAIIGLIEGIIYLTKSDQDFVRTYVDNEKQWF